MYYVLFSGGFSKKHFQNISNSMHKYIHVPNAGYVSDITFSKFWNSVKLFLSSTEFPANFHQDKFDSNLLWWVRTYWTILLSFEPKLGLKKSQIYFAKFKAKTSHAWLHRCTENPGFLHLALATWPDAPLENDEFWAWVLRCTKYDGFLQRVLVTWPNGKAENGEFWDTYT